MIRSLALIALVTEALSTVDAAAQQQGCFVGVDAAGGQARMILQVERYGEFFEVWGQVASQSIGVMKIKADGHSGAGRIYRNHEYESGALFIQISNFSAQGLVLEVQGYGRFPFRTVPC